MCVLAAILGAADLGYRTILVSDAVGSTSDEAHDAMLEPSPSATASTSRSGLAEEVAEPLAAAAASMIERDRP